MKKCPLYESRYSYLCSNMDECSGNISCEYYQKNKISFDRYMTSIARENFRNFYNKLVGLNTE